MGRALQIAGFLIGILGLVLQFAITIPAAMASGRSLGGAIVFYFSFFTILTNITAVTVHAASLSGGRPRFLSAFARPRVRAGTAVAIAMVCIVYATILARLWQPQGLFYLCDILLHYVTPILFVTWWLFFGADGSLRWRDILYWIAYPTLYLVYALLRAPIAGEVPYPFLDVAAKGWASVAVSALSMTALFVLLSALAVLADRGISRIRRK